MFSVNDNNYKVSYYKKQHVLHGADIHYILQPLFTYSIRYRPIVRETQIIQNYINRYTVVKTVECSTTAISSLESKLF